jgi:hypothetical protein
MAVLDAMFLVPQSIPWLDLQTRLYRFRFACACDTRERTLAGPTILLLLKDMTVGQSQGHGANT